MDLSTLQALLGVPQNQFNAPFSTIFPSPSSTTPQAPAPPLPPHTEKRYIDALFRSYPSLGLDVVFAPPPSSSVHKSAGAEVHTQKSRGMDDSAEGWLVDRLDIYNPPDPAAAAAAAAVGTVTAGGRRRIAKAQPTRSAPPFPIRVKMAKRPDMPPRPAPVPGAQPVAATSTSPSTATSPGRPSNSASAGINEGGSADHPADLFLEIKAQTTGADFVRVLGEPDRKGGGDQWVAPWLEWTSVEVVRADDDRISPTGEAGADPGPDPIKLGLMVELRPPPPTASSDSGRPGAAGGARNEVHMPYGGVWDVAGRWEWECLKVFHAS